MAIGEAPVLEALTDINAVSIARTELDPATLILVRVAALVAVDAPAASYLMHIGPAMESGLKVEDIQDVLVAVAPITGAPRVLAAAGRITDALGVAIAIVEADAAGMSGGGRDGGPGAKPPAGKRGGWGATRRSGHGAGDVECGPGHN